LNRTLQEAVARLHSIPERRHRWAIARLRHIYAWSGHPRKPTEVARFLTCHGPTPSDFGWPGYQFCLQ